MEDAATTIYCLCEEFLEAIDRWDDPRAKLSTAGV